MLKVRRKIIRTILFKIIDTGTRTNYETGIRILATGTAAHGITQAITVPRSTDGTHLITLEIILVTEALGAIHIFNRVGQARSAITGVITGITDGELATIMVPRMMHGDPLTGITILHGIHVITMDMEEVMATVIPL